MNVHTIDLTELLDDSDATLPMIDLPTLIALRGRTKQSLWNRTRGSVISFLSRGCKSAIVTWKENEDALRALFEEGQRLIYAAVWRHHSTTIDTSNALLWLNTPANLIRPSRPFINGLPDEILTRIFAFVLHSNYRTPQDRVSKKIRYGIFSGSSPTPPWLLGHVCSRWLELVSSSPILWSTIAVCSPSEKHIAQVVYWLERSKKCPLNISVEQYVTPNPMCTAILHLLVAQAHRWRKVHLVLVDETPFKRLQPGDVPLLEEFRVRAGSTRKKPGRVGRIFQVFHSSTALKHADWGHSYSPAFVAHTPWAQLTSITLHDVELTQATVDALAMCGDTLVSLELDHVSWPEDVFSQIVMTRLNHFVCQSVQGGAKAFTDLTVPNLVHLQLIAMDPYAFFGPVAADRPCVFASAVTMMERSGCNLKSFAIDSFWLARVLALHEETTVFNHVETLAVYGYPDDAATFGKLAKDLTLFPGLQHLSLENLITPDGVFGDVILAREDQLRSVSVAMRARDHRVDRAVLCWMNKAGMAVDVHPFLSCGQEAGRRWEELSLMLHTTPTQYFPEYDRHWIL